VRREQESAIDAQDFETAAALRDKEKDLLATRTSRESEWTPPLPAAHPWPGNSPTER
jgi:hypothetical protein